MRDRLPHLKAIVQYLPGEVDPEQRDQGVLSWEEFMDIGKVSETMYFVLLSSVCEQLHLLSSYGAHMQHCFTCTCVWFFREGTAVLV